MHRGAQWPLIGLGALLIAVAAVSFRRAVKLEYDFHHFYRDGAYVWQNGALNPNLNGPDRQEQRRLRFYLPAVALLLSPVTSGGVLPAAIIWTMLHLVCLAYSLKVLVDWSVGSGARAPPRAVLAAVTALALPAIYEAARFNQLSFFVLAIVLAGVTALERRKPVQAGVWLGLATVVKLLPAVFVVWLLLKRQWVAAGVCVAAVAVVALAPCLAVFGPHQTAEYHRQWWNDNVRGAAARGMTDPALRSHFIDHRNQSIAAVVARLCWSAHPQSFSHQPLELSRHACRRLSQGLALVLAAVLVWLTRRPIRIGSHNGAPRPELCDRGRSETAVYLIGMLVFSPLLRTYYLVWALPGLVLLARQALEPDDRSGRRLGRLGLSLWLLGMLAWMSDTLRACGVHLVMLIVLSAILLLAASRADARAVTAAGRSGRRCARQTQTSCSSPS